MGLGRVAAAFPDKGGGGQEKIVAWGCCPPSDQNPRSNYLCLAISILSSRSGTRVSWCTPLGVPKEAGLRNGGGQKIADCSRPMPKTHEKLNGWATWIFQCDKVT